MEKISEDRIYTMPEMANLSEVQRSGVQTFTDVCIDRIHNSMVDAIVDVADDGLWLKFLEAQELDYQLSDDTQPDGPLGRHLDTFIEKAQELVDGTA